MLVNLVMVIWLPRIPIRMYPGRMAESCGTTYAARQSSTYYEPYYRTYLPDAWYRQLFEETANLDWLSVLTACQNHGMEAILNSREYLRIALKHFDNFRICLLDDPNRPRQQLGPSCQASSVVRRSEEDDAAGRMENLLEVSFPSLLRRDQGLGRCHRR